MVAIPFVGAVHQRAIRLTRKRLDASVPLSVKEMMAEKDALRGKFAAATVALEGGIESLKQKGAGACRRAWSQDRGDQPAESRAG